MDKTELGDYVVSDCITNGWVCDASGIFKRLINIELKRGVNDISQFGDKVYCGRKIIGYRNDYCDYFDTNDRGIYQ